MQSDDLYILETKQAQKIQKSQESNLLIKIFDLELSTRTYNCLINDNINCIGDLVIRTYADLRSIPKMGAKCIIEVQEKLSEYNLTLGMDLDSWPLKEKETEINDIQKDHTNNFTNDNKKKIEKIKVIELVKELEETSLSVRSINALRNLNCNFVGDILFLNKKQLLSMPNLGLQSANEIEKFINHIGFSFGDKIFPWESEKIKKLRLDLKESIIKSEKESEASKDKYLEIELIRILTENIKPSNYKQNTQDRTIDVIIGRYGLDGSPAKTLETIGQKYNVTRERIRQNQAKGIRKLKIIKPHTPILDKVFKLLLDHLPITEKDCNRILKEKNLTQNEWDINGLQDFYETFSEKLDLYVSKTNEVKLINSSNNNFLKIILEQTDKKISNSGVFSISDCMNLKEVYLNNIKPETIINIVQTKPLFSWLDKEKNWFTYYSTRNRLSNLIKKAVSASSVINVESLYTKIKKFPRISKNLNLKKNIFIEFCLTAFDCSIDNDNLVFSSSKSKLSSTSGYDGKIISPNEQKILDIFNNYGPILNWLHLKELANKFDITDHSLNIIMQFSVLFQRIDKSTYVLSNKKYNLNDVPTFKIDISNESFDPSSCEYISNEIGYIEVYDFGKYKFNMNYPQPLRSVMGSYKGVLLDKKIYIILGI
ncbi:MAG: hypothetical protein ISQ17_00660 [Pelagibacteraceae bacterium]|nr:hypothetical protein [Pelagibacteraceae bacterium]